MEIIILPTPSDVARTAADAIEEQVRSGPSVLGLATGSTPLGTYQELIERHRNGLSFARAQAFLLDEYVGLPSAHPQSYHSVIRDEFTDNVDFGPDAVHGLDGMAADPGAETAQYEARIAAAGGVDIQILGIGTDGHIGFNEPMSSLASRTRIKTLTQQTRQDTNDDAGRAGTQRGRHVAVNHVQLIGGVGEVARPRPDQHMDRDTFPARLLHSADARRDALRLRQGCAQFDAGCADGGGEPDAVGILHSKLQLGPVARVAGRRGNGLQGRFPPLAQSPCHAGFRPNVSW